MKASERRDNLNSLYVSNQIASIFYPVNLYILADHRLSSQPNYVNI